MRNLVLVGIAMWTLIPGSAMAGELPVIPPAYPVGPPPPLLLPVYSWTGCYIGGHLGGVWGRKEVTASTMIGAPVGTPLGSHDAHYLLGGVHGASIIQDAG